MSDQPPSINTCSTCAHHVSDGCLHPALVAASYSSLYFHPPMPDFGCSFHVSLTSASAPPPDEEMIPHPFNSRGLGEGHWCKDCE
jgi:hypothetical protein